MERRGTALRFQFFILVTLAVLTAPATGGELARFRFESIRSLDDMRDSIRSVFKIGSSRSDVRRYFVEQGEATLITHPAIPGVEKYIYDINLCRVYIWRWNISADFGTGDDLHQIYVNGDAVLDNAAQDALEPGPEKTEGRQVTVYKGSRPRPEATSGENALGYVLIDADGDLGTTDDQKIMGGGPTRADPNDLGKMHAYLTVPWRSIFDNDDTRAIVPFDGSCPKTP